MLIWSPFGEPRQVLDYLAGVRVEDVWSVSVDKIAGCVELVIRVATYVTAAVDHQHRPPFRGQPFGDHTAREAGTDYDRVVSHG